MNKSVLLLLITLFLIPKEVKPQFSKEIIKQLQKQAKAQKAPVNLNTKYNLTNFG